MICLYHPDAYLILLEQTNDGFADALGIKIGVLRGVWLLLCLEFYALMSVRTG